MERGTPRAWRQPCKSRLITCWPADLCWVLHYLCHVILMGCISSDRLLHLSISWEGSWDIWYPVENRDKRQRLYLGVAGIWCFWGVSGCRHGTFPQSVKVPCGGQWFTGRQTSFSTSPYSLKRQQDGEKQVNKNSCPEQRWSWKEQLYKPLEVRVRSPRASWIPTNVPADVLRAQVLFVWAGTWHQWPSVSTFPTSLCLPSRKRRYP